MASTSAATCGFAIGHQLAISIVVLSIALLSPGHAMPRPSLGAMPAQLLYNELLETGPVNEDKTYYNEQQLKYPQEQKPFQATNYFVNKWPSLRDLLLTADYDDSSSVESGERDRYPLGSRLLERLHQLGDNGEGFANTLDDLTAMKTKKHSKVQSNSKQHNIKKNVQFRKNYMSPCHFKICNMGRKRNSGSNLPY